MGSGLKWSGIGTAPRAELSSIFVCLPPQLPLAEEPDHADGSYEWGVVDHVEALQVDDHVLASFGDDLPNILAVLL